MKKISGLILGLTLLFAVHADASDQRAQFNERAVGANHPTLSDTINRLALVEHNNDGTHGIVNANDIITKGPWVDVRAFLPDGYVTDGSVDYSTQFQAASDSLTDKGTLKVPPGTFSLIGWTINNSIIVVGSGKNNTILQPFSTGTVLTFGGGYFGLRDIRFEHDRSFNATAVRIDSATSTVNRYFDIERVFITNFLGAGIHIDNAVLETTIRHLQIRICGDPAQDLAALEIKNPTGDADSLNNFIIENSIIGLSRYYAIRAVGGNDVGSTTGLRKFTLKDLMIHGGTDESNITPYAGDSVLIDGFSDLNITRINFAQIATTFYGLVLQSSLTNRGVTGRVSDSVFGGENNGNGIKLDNTADISIAENNFQATFTNDIRIEADSRRTKIRPQNILLGSAIKLSDASPAGNTTIEGINSVIANFSDGDSTPSVNQGRLFKEISTAPNTITTFDDDLRGQEIIIMFSTSNATIDFTGTNLKGNAGVDWSPTAGDHMTCVFDGTNWFCDISDNTA